MRMFKTLEDSLEQYFSLPEMFVVMSADSKGTARLKTALDSSSEDSILYLAGNAEHTSQGKNYLVAQGFPQNQIRTENSSVQSSERGTWRAYLDITRAFENFGERDITLITDTDLLECHEELAQEVSSKQVVALPSGYKGSLFRQGMVMLETKALRKDLRKAKQHNSTLIDGYPEFTNIGPRSPYSLMQYLTQLLER